MVIGTAATEKIFRYRDMFLVSKFIEMFVFLFFFIGLST